MPFDPVQLSGNGPLIPGIIYGSGSDWRKNPRPEEDGVAREVVEAVKDAVNAGFRAFDTAQAYKTEKSLGVGLKESGIPRSELFLASKVTTAESLADPAKLVKEQLALLGTDYLDLYLIHTPRSVKDGITFASAWASLEALVDEGLVRAIGVSNFDKKHFEEFIHEARIKPAVNQISLYPYIYEKNREIIEYSKLHNITLQAYEVSTSLIREGEKGGPLDPVLAQILSDLAATGHSATPGQVLLSWAAAHGFVPVTTSSKASRMKEYVAAGDFRLTVAQVEAIDAAGKEGAEKGYGAYWSWTGA